MSILLLKDKERIRSKLESRRSIEPNKCWRWLGACNKDGYGSIHMFEGTFNVHRISYYVYIGFDINDKTIHVLHKLDCPNKDCFNPEHLYIGDHADNMHDISIKVNARPLFKCGHERTPDNNYTFFREDRGVWESQCIICTMQRKTYRIK